MGLVKSDRWQDGGGVVAFLFGFNMQFANRYPYYTHTRTYMYIIYTHIYVALWVVLNLAFSSCKARFVGMARG